MNVHFFVRTLNETNGGGSHHNAISYIRALRERGHSVTVHTFEPQNNEPPGDIPIMAHSGSGLGVTKSRDYLCELLRSSEKEADVFFLYGTDFTWGGGKYRRQGGRVPVVVYLDTYLFSMGLMREDSFSAWQQFSYRMKRLAWDKFFGLADAAHVDRFCAVSPFVRDAYVRFGFPKGKFAVVPNFFEPVQPLAHAHREGPLRLLYTGRFTHDKGTDLLIRALSGLQGFSWTLRLVGDGPQKDALKKLIRDSGLSSRVEIVPWVDAKALAEEYASTDIFVHPARWPEPFGRTVVEAMMNGVPVIVPERGGASWIADGACLMFGNGSERELRAAIERLVADGVLRTELGRKGFERAKAFRKEVVAPELEQTLNSVYNATA